MSKARIILAVALMLLSYSIGIKVLFAEENVSPYLQAVKGEF